MNLPNILTCSRLVLALVLMGLLATAFPWAKSLALIVFVLAGITDYLDGHLARTVYGVTTFGRLMDPLADKIIVTAALVSFVGLRLTGWSYSLVPAWIVVLIIAREFMVTGLRLVAATQNQVLAAGRWGKHKTVWQIIVISVLLLGLAIRYDLLSGAAPALLAQYDRVFGITAWSLSAIMALITLVSGGVYFYEHAGLLRRRESAAPSAAQ